MSNGQILFKKNDSADSTSDKASADENIDNQDTKRRNSSIEQPHNSAISSNSETAVDKGDPKSALSQREVKVEQSDSDGSRIDTELRRLISYYDEIYEFKKKDTVSPIHVDELASKFAGLYEQVRRVIDWKEEHLIRRTAIDRSLKRRMLSKLSGINIRPSLSGKDIAEPLVLELIRGGYFANDSISKNKLPKVEKVIDKYIYILSHNTVLQSLSPLAIKRKVEFYNWILEVAACEIEEVLDPPLKERGLLNYMTNKMISKIEVNPSDAIPNEQKVMQIYIAVHRTLFNLDDPVITYDLIKFRYPSWTNHPSQVVKEFTENLFDIWRDLDKQLKSKVGTEFYKVCERYDAVYRILGDVLNKLNKNEKDKLEIFEDWDKLKEVIKERYDKRVSTLKSRLFRSAIFSTLSIFLAGGLSLFIFEVPLAKLFLGEFSLVAVAVDLMIPTVLMFILVSLIRPAGKKNFKRLLGEVKKLIYTDTPEDIYGVEFNKKKKVIKNLFFGIVYLIVTAVSFGFVFWIFKIANVPWTSLYIDTANIAVVVFAALVIKQKSKEVTVNENVGFADFLVELFSIPLARLGQWLSAKWKEYNFLSVFFTVAVDLPVLSIVEIIEDWRSFLKDKKADIH